MNKKNNVYVFGGFVGLVMFGLGIGIAPLPVRQVTTEYHYNQTLQFNNSDIVRDVTVSLPIEGDAVVECTVSDEWAVGFNEYAQSKSNSYTGANCTAQWLDDLGFVSVTVSISGTSNLPVEVSVSVYPVNYVPLVQSDSK